MENICDTISIFDAASKFGVALKGKGKLYCSPFRKDEHPSFSIFGDGKLFKDLATGETGNVISFTAKLKGISNKEAYKLLLSEFDNGSFNAVSSGRHSLDSLNEKKPRKGDINAPKKLLWNDALADIVAKRYSVSAGSLKHAFDAGCFGFGNSNKTGNVWIVGDNRKLSYQIRRMDGNNWKFSGNEAKAWTLKNSDCSYPIGLENAKDKQAICICEGGHRFPVVLPYSENAQYARHPRARRDAWREPQNRHSLFARVRGESRNDFCGRRRGGAKGRHGLGKPT